MRSVAETYPFLALSVMLAAIGLLLVLVRRDLGRMYLVTALCALPFAFTEPLFYPEYWSPPFLFDLGRRWGFGIEDFLFVASLALVAAGVFPVVTGAQLDRLGQRSGLRIPLVRLAMLLGGVGLGTAALLACRIPAMYAALLLMGAALVWVLMRRPNLLGPALGGGLLTGLLYAVVLGLMDRLCSGAIERYWHADQFLNRNWSGLPLEEWLYGFGAGTLGAVFYPYVAGYGFTVNGNRGRAQIVSWLISMRLPAQSHIFFPLLLGQLVAARRLGHFDWGAAAWLHLYGLFIHLFIVWANDYADEKVDRLNHTYTLFSGGSRVLPEGLLTRRHLRAATRWALAASALTGLGLAVLHGYMLAPLFVFVSWMLLWAYSFPPLRASYRGFGEALQMAGVGLLLPLFGFYVQGSPPLAFPLWLPVAVLPTQYACALTTALPDAPSDAMGNKRTLPVRLGTRRTRGLILLLHAVSITVIGLGAISLRTPAWITPLLFAPLLAGWVLLTRRAAPGTRAMSGAVALSVAITVLLMVWLGAFTVPDI